MEPSSNIFVLVLQVLLIKASTSDETISKTYEDPLEPEYGQVQHVSIFFRHGDRTTLAQYPNNPNKNYTWPVGPGQLLDGGKRKHVKNGEWFKQRYSQLTGETYDNEQLRVQSSDVDRTIMSAYCFLFGYFPTMESQSWYEDERWQPIPVHTIPEEYDNVIQLTRECPRIKELDDEAFKSPQFKEVLDKHSSTIKYMAKQSGFNFADASPYETYYMLGGLRDIFTVESCNNLTMPTWTKSIFPQPLESIMQELYFVLGASVEKKKLSAGPFLASLTSDMKQKSTRNNFTQTLHIYSGHDTTIFYILNALGIDNPTWPPYAATLIFELRKNSENYFVTISFKNTTDMAYPMKLPGYGAACTLEQFLAITQPLIPDDWAMECEVKSAHSACSLVTASSYCLVILFSIIRGWIN